MKHTLAVAAGLAAAIAAAPVAAQLQQGEVYAGAAKVNIEPTPDASMGEIWEQDEAACELDFSDDGAVFLFESLFGADTRTPWPENPQCIYSGGFGIGPMNSLTSFDQTYGLWVRSFAISDGPDTVVLTILDGAYYMGRYRNLCQRCGFFELAEDLGRELRIPRSGFVFASSHSHAAPDFIGGWGAVPQWYMDQVTEAMRTSVRQAVANMQPATLEMGDELAREWNTDRRDIYWSPEENTLSWFRAVSRSGDVIGTLGVYARHPTSSGSGPVAHPDWHGPFNKRLEDRFGGVGLSFPSGLGNKSSRGGWPSGETLANRIPEVGGGVPVTGPGGAAPDIRTAQTFWVHPVTNSALTGLGVPGLFDRPFTTGAATVNTGKADITSPSRCNSSSTVVVETAISAIRIGGASACTALGADRCGLTITGGPGELFSNITNTIREEEYERGHIATPISLANDGLGYIMQRFEYNEIAGQLVGFVDDGLFGYEDAYAIDGCLGTKVLEETLNALNGL